MVDTAVLTMVKDIVTILGVVGGFTYYVMTIRNQRENQQLVSVNNMISALRDEKMYRNFLESLDFEWVDFEDFTRKYKTHEQEPKWMPIMNYFDSFGYLWKKGVVTIKDLSNSFRYGYILYWRKFKPIVKAHRRYYKDLFLDFEEFAEALEAEIGDRIE